MFKVNNKKITRIIDVVLVFLLLTLNLFLKFPLLTLNKYVLAGLLANIHLLEVNNRNTKKGVKYVQSNFINKENQKRGSNTGVFL